MFAFSFHFPAGRYHATPWGRNVNEADVAWPPEPWRLLRALIAVYRRKGNRERWSEDHLGTLIQRLAERPPEYRLPVGAIHAHTRHYMPSGPKTTLVFDAFLRLPIDATLVVSWPRVSLEPELFSLAADLADAIGYLGRAESWTECEAHAVWDGQSNCCPAIMDLQGDPVRLIVPLGQDEYSTERERIMSEVERQVSATAKRPLTKRQIESKVAKALISKGSGTHTLPERLVDALALDTADFQDCGWSRPPASREILYTRAPEVVAGTVSRRRVGRRSSRTGQQRLPTVARFLLAGRPRPRIEDAVTIGELMRRAALSQFGWRKDEATGRPFPNAPSEISGRDAEGKPLKTPSHVHAFWLPEDADEDGRIDHVSVFVRGGMDEDIQAKLGRITRLWLARGPRSEEVEEEPGNVKEWRLALEGFGQPSDFAGDARIFARSRRWRSVTPFLAAGHLKAGYRGEIHRLLRRRGMDIAGVEVEVLDDISVGGTKRRALHYRRFRSRGRERRPDSAGALLEVAFPAAEEGPLAIGYGSHFGLGLFVGEPIGDD